MKEEKYDEVRVLTADMKADNVKLAQLRDRLSVENKGSGAADKNMYDKDGKSTKSFSDAHYIVPNSQQILVDDGGNKFLLKKEEDFSKFDDKQKQDAQRAFKEKEPQFLKVQEVVDGNRQVALNRVQQAQASPAENPAPEGQNPDNYSPEGQLGSELSDQPGGAGPEGQPGSGLDDQPGAGPEGEPGSGSDDQSGAGPEGEPGSGLDDQPGSAPTLKPQSQSSKDDEPGAKYEPSGRSPNPGDAPASSSSPTMSSLPDTQTAPYLRVAQAYNSSGVGNAFQQQQASASADSSSSLGADSSPSASVAPPSPSPSASPSP